MTSTLVEFPPAVATKSRLPRHRKAARPLPAVFIGTLPGFRELPAIDLYNLLTPVGEHPAGSTVSGRTLERHGYRVPVVERHRSEPALAC
jgi:hypothetical protein